MKIEFKDNIIVFDVQYGKGKRLAIQMDSVGHLTVKAPKDATEEMIIKGVEAHGNLILKKLDEISKARELEKPKEYKEDERFLYLGKEYPLSELIETSGLGNEDLKDLPNAIKKFYISSCKKIIGERIKIYQKQLGAKPKSVDVMESKTQWGSCTWDKKINFNYKLVMCPVEVIDYVVVHELCHLYHMNHDRSFWRRVGSIVPDYKEKQDYLARHGKYMSL